MTSQEIRQQFIDFFKKKNHVFKRSSPVVPLDDHTLLFNNAGMNQFKPIFLGMESANQKRVMNSQKCIRVSGKHNDLEEVGVDDYHHTFFEMLGNWSFGDYYKKEAIKWAWELLTDVWKMEKNRLWVTIFQDDDEAGELWKKHTDISSERIIKFGHKENFWEMGEVGPCGPCTEIHYYIGDNLKEQKPSGVNSDSNYREIWNLVFIQYNRNEENKLIELPDKHVDTGAGLERIVAILNGKKSNYDTDLFLPIIDEISNISGNKYSSKDGIAHRVLSDHLRMLVFSIADGAMPGNEGRGYVLRRVLRRASRFGRTLGLSKPFISKLVPTLVKIMGSSYPELQEKQAHIEKVIYSEEKSFNNTLDKGLIIFDKLVSQMKPGDVISGKEIFKLYDTYGFPVDLTALMAREKELTIDIEKFEILMDKQKISARKSGKFKRITKNSDWVQLNKEKANIFIGYKQSESISQIHKYRLDNKFVEIVLDNTPFYAEQGGQIGDIGTLQNNSFRFEVINTILIHDDIVHYGILKKGKISKAGKFTAKIDINRRQKIRLNHTATHLLHKSMKLILGDHVHQAGSLVAPDRLRFDYTHHEKLSMEEKKLIEQKVNDIIRSNTKVKTSVMDFDSAQESGATALFGEKYGDEVRVVEVDGFSSELCGGTHVSRTGDIGSFKITSESSLSSGVRRVEAITGSEVLLWMISKEKMLSNIQELLKCSRNEIIERINILLKNKHKLDKEIKHNQANINSDIVEDILSKSKKKSNVNVIVEKIDYSGDLMLLGDQIRMKFGNKGICLLGSIFNNKPIILCAITDTLLGRFHAGDIVKEVGSKIDGGGGGKAHIACAGGKDITLLDSALEFGKILIYNQLNNE